MTLDIELVRIQNVLDVAEYADGKLTDGQRNELERLIKEIEHE